MKFVKKNPFNKFYLLKNVIMHRVDLPNTPTNITNLKHILINETMTTYFIHFLFLNLGCTYYKRSVDCLRPLHRS